MRQRLGIAQAIAGNPRLIIVDEPTAGLDPEERLRFYRLLSELAENRIVLLSTHIVEDVAVLCPRFAIIRNGRLVANTTPGEARKAIEGTIYEGTISAEDYDGCSPIPSEPSPRAYLVEGRNRVRVYQPEANHRPGSRPSQQPWKTPTSSRSKRAVSMPSTRARLTLSASAGVSTNGNGPDFKPVGWSEVSREQDDHAEPAAILNSDGWRFAYHARRPLFIVWAVSLLFIA